VHVNSVDPLILTSIEPVTLYVNNVFKGPLKESTSTESTPSVCIEQ